MSTKQEVLTRTHKICGTCKKDLPLDAFGKSSSHTDGLKTECKKCHNIQSKERYANNRTQCRMRMKKRHQDRRDIVDDAKNKPCADCKQSFPSPVMHFHHRDPSYKVSEVANLMKGKLDILLAEIKKCDILCTNCHILRHMNEPYLGGRPVA